jgi:hypothetical protein
LIVALQGTFERSIGCWERTSGLVWVLASDAEPERGIADQARI